MEQMLTTTFRCRHLTSWQREALEEAAGIYAECLVALCRWAEANLALHDLSQQSVDTPAVRRLLPPAQEVAPLAASLHSALRDHLVWDAAAKVTSYTSLLKAEREGKLDGRPGFWASRVKEPPPLEYLLEEAIYRMMLEEEEYRRWMGGLLSHGWLAKARRPQLGEQLLFLGVKGSRGCHLLAQQRNGHLLAAAVVYVGRAGLYPKLTIPSEAGWIDLGEGRPFAVRSSCTLYLPLQAESPYLRRYLEMGLEGKARPVTARLYRHRHHDEQPWAWYLAVTWRVQCPEPYTPTAWAIASAGWRKGEGPKVTITLPDGGERELFQDYWERLRGVMREQFLKRRRLQQRGRDISGLHREGAEWELSLHLTARELVTICQQQGWGLEWQGGAPRRLKRLPELAMRKARLAGVPARWTKRPAAEVEGEDT